MPVDDRIPPFLTVEEASRLLKIGRTNAYDLTKEWRATGGRSGLPVVDLGDVLRVPGPAIEHMLGIALGTPRPTKVKPTGVTQNRPTGSHRPAFRNSAPEESPAPPEVKPAAGAVTAPGVRAGRTRHPRRPINQLPLFQPLTPTNPDPQTPPPDDPELTTHP